MIEGHQSDYHGDELGTKIKKSKKNMDEDHEINPNASSPYF